MATSCKLLINVQGEAPKPLTLPVIKTDGNFAVEDVQKALASIPEYLDCSLDMVEILNYSGDELELGDTIDFIVQQIPSARRHEKRKFLLHEERTENAKNIAALTTQAEKLAKLRVQDKQTLQLQKQTFTKFLQELQSQTKALLEEHHKILLYETLTRIVRAYNDIIMDTKRPSGNRQVLTMSEKKKLKTNGLNFITKILHASGSNDTKARIARKALQCLSEGEQALVSGVQEAVDSIKLERHSTQHPRPSRSFSITLLQSLTNPPFNVNAAVEFISSNPTSPLTAEADKSFFADVDDPTKTALEAKILHFQDLLKALDTEDEDLE